VHRTTFPLFPTKCSFNLVAPPPRNSFTQYLHLNPRNKFSPCSHTTSLSPSIPATMDETKQMYHKNSCQARHICPPSWITERLAGHVRPLAGFQRGWPDMSAPLTEFQRGWLDMSGPRSGHVRVSEGIGLSIYRRIYRLGWRFSVGFHPPLSRAPPDFRSNPVAFHPAVMVFFGYLPALAPRSVYRFSRRLPPDSWRFLPHRRRFRPSQIGFGSSLDRGK
jgi:hypothetical protein